MFTASPVLRHAEQKAAAQQHQRALGVYQDQPLAYTCSTCTSIYFYVKYEKRCCHCDIYLSSVMLRRKQLLSWGVAVPAWNRVGLAWMKNLRLMRSYVSKAAGRSVPWIPSATRMNCSVVTAAVAAGTAAVSDSNSDTVLLTNWQTGALARNDLYHLYTLLHRQAATFPAHVARESKPGLL